MRSALRFQTASTPRQFGETARLKIVRGPDQGALFVLVGPRASIGRGTEADVQLSDPKTSRKHAELVLGSDGRWSVKDLGSSNGILVNDELRESSAVLSGDFVSLGETTFEFGASAAESTRVLMAPARAAGDQKLMLEAREREKRRVQRLGRFGGGLPDAAPTPRASGERKFSPVTLVVLAAGAFFLLFDDSPKKPVPAKKPVAKAGAKAGDEGQRAARDLANFLPHDPNAPVEATDGPNTVDNFFRSGFREFTKGNYLRAKRQFETALQIDPVHIPSRSYLGKTEQAISQEIEDHLLLGKRKLDAGQNREAKGHFEAVLRFLHRDREHPKYREAREQLERAVDALKGGTG